MKILIIASSLKKTSKSHVLARIINDKLQQQSLDVDFLSLQDYDIPFCDGSTAYGHETTSILKNKIQSASSIIIVTPIYNYDANSAIKNVVELTGQQWNHKVVSFACVAGGSNSYMSIMGLANSLMLDFRCAIVPRFVYATEKDFDQQALINNDVLSRLDQLILTHLKFQNGLHEYTLSAPKPKW